MRAAIFDIDGVLTKGFAIRRFWNHLAEKGVINAAPLFTSKKIFDKFHKGEISYKEMGNSVMENVALAFRGTDQKEVDDESKNFFRSKKKVLQGLSGIDKFIGFGDTEQDIPILESVKVPVAINPNKELESAATEKGWKILRETDDVVEEVRRLL